MAVRQGPLDHGSLQAPSPEHAPAGRTSEYICAPTPLDDETRRSAHGSQAAPETGANKAVNTARAPEQIGATLEPTHELDR